MKANIIIDFKGNELTLFKKGLDKKVEIADYLHDIYIRDGKVLLISKKGALWAATTDFPGDHNIFGLKLSPEDIEISDCTHQPSSRVVHIIDKLLISVDRDLVKKKDDNDKGLWFKMLNM